ncbi:MAG: archease [Spirochaetes bacterium]|nr:archease [Spirochaetota bacterium]
MRGYEDSRFWEIKDHTADVMIEGGGKTLSQSFEGIALALQNVIVDTNTVQKSKKISDCIRLKGSYEDLLFAFLSRLVYIKDVKKFFFSDIQVQISDNSDVMELCFTIYGENINLKKHSTLTDVKGVSYSGLVIFKEKDYYICRCIVDV